MPQFDTFSFFSQLVWVLIAFSYLYLALCLYILPAFAAVLKIRARKISQINTNSSNINVVTNTTTSNSLFFENLTGKINKVNDLNREELKAYYKQVLNNGEISDKGGGGLGFIDIAKKSGEKLVYNIREIDENYSFFTLTVKISQIWL